MMQNNIISNSLFLDFRVLILIFLVFSQACLEALTPSYDEPDGAFKISLTEDELEVDYSQLSAGDFDDGHQTAVWLEFECMESGIFEFQHENGWVTTIVPYVEVASGLIQLNPSENYVRVYRGLNYKFRLHDIGSELLYEIDPDNLFIERIKWNYFKNEGMVDFETLLGPQGEKQLDETRTRYLWESPEEGAVKLSSDYDVSNIYVYELDMNRSEFLNFIHDIESDEKLGFDWNSDWSDEWESMRPQEVKYIYTNNNGWDLGAESVFDYSKDGSSENLVGKPRKKNGKRGSREGKVHGWIH